MKLATIILYLVSFAFYFVISYNTPRVGDDNMYLTKYYQGVDVPDGKYGTWESVQLAGNTFQRSNEMAWWEFQNDTGRFMDFVCGWHLIPYPKIVFSIASALVWLMLMHLIWMVSGASAKWRLSIFAWSYFVLLQNDATLWMGGTSAYLWPVAWSLLLVPVFLASRLDEPALQKRNWWMWIVVPIFGFCGGGWHEIIGVPICFLLALFWVKRIVATRRIEINGKLILSFFFGLASLVVVFAPSSLARFDRQSSSSFAYMALIKCMALANTILFNPVGLIAIAVLVVMLVRKRNRSMVINRCGYWILMLVFMIGIVCVLGEGADRTSWPVTVLALIILLRLIPFETLNPRCARAFSIIGVGAAMLTFVYSLYGVYNTRIDHENAVADWYNGKDDLCATPDNPDSLLGFLFDRSLPARSLVWFGPTSTQNMNPALAAKFNRKILLGLPADALEAFGNGAKFCTSERALNCGSDKIWYSDPSLDIVVRPMDDSENLPYGKELSANITYSTQPGFNMSKLWDIMSYDFRRFSGGASIFKVSNFYQTFSRDVIYSTLYKSKLAKAFVVNTETGRYLIVQHNRFCNRESITSIDVK